MYENILYKIDFGVIKKMFEEEYDEDNPRFRDEFGCVNDLLTGESYICGNSAFIGERDALDTAIELCELLNGLYNENKKLKYSNKILRLNKKSCEKGRKYEREKDLNDKLNEDFCLVDGKIFVKFARIFELIEDAECLESLEAICGADLNYIVATYLEPK